MAENEKQFEANIEAFLISSDGGYTKANDTGYRKSIDMALDIETLVSFVKTTQPIMWQRFERQCNSDVNQKFYKCFEDAVLEKGLVNVLRHGFKYLGMEFKVCYEKCSAEGQYAGYFAEVYQLSGNAEKYQEGWQDSNCNQEKADIPTVPPAGRGTQADFARIGEWYGL